MRNLGELESEVMTRVWDWQRPCTVREVHEDLSRDRKIAYTTVLTVLDNLHKKGLVTREPVGRAYYYQSVGTREEHTADLIAVILEHSQDRPASLLKFVERLDSREVSHLRAALNALAPPTRDRRKQGR